MPGYYGMSVDDIVLLVKARDICSLIGAAQAKDAVTQVLKQSALIPDKPSVLKGDSGA